MSGLQWLVIGIAGVTNGGKTTLCEHLKQRFPTTSVISMDDYFYENDSPNHIWIEELNHQDWDVISSVDMTRLHKDIKQWVATASQPDANTELSDLPVSVTNSQLKNSSNSAPCGKDSSSHSISNVNGTDTNNNIPILIVEGILIFNYKPLLPYFHRKYFFTLDKETCFRRREGRHYDPPDPAGYFDKVVWPRYLEYKQEVKMLPDVVYLDGSMTQVAITNLVDRDLRRILEGNDSTHQVA